MSMSRYYLVSENAHCNMWISSNDLNYQINQRLSIQRAGWSWQKVIKTFGNKCHLCFLCKKTASFQNFRAWARLQSIDLERYRTELEVCGTK